MTLALVAAACVPASGTSSTATSAPDGTTVHGIGAGLSATDDLVATVVATGLPNVAALAVDGQGRLWASTAAYSDAGTDEVLLVDGATTTRVIDGLDTPLGLAWVGDRLFVASARGVDAYAGFDGARFASHTTIVDLPTGVGEVNGLAVAPDGSLVLGISAPCDACRPSSPFSGSVVAFEADGSGLHGLATGLRAPVGLAYVPGASTLLASENQRDDLGDATPGDWLIRVEAGQAWGFPDCYGQGGTACAGTPEPVATLDPHAAVGEVAIVDRSWSKTATADGTALVAEWARGTVMAVDVGADGAAASTPRVLVAGLSQPFGVLATDGGVLIGDWGAGTIYRVARGRPDGTIG
jgi:glucose/arabinose dehydrogenase